MRSLSTNPRRAFAPVMWAVVVVFIVAAAVYAYRANVSRQPSITRGAAAASDSRGSAGQIAFVDPVTGLPREPTAAELAQLQSLRPASVTSPPVFIISPTTGLEGLELTEDQMVYSVATKNAKGTISVREVKGARAADQAVHGVPPSDGLQVGKAARDDR